MGTENRDIWSLQQSLDGFGKAGRLRTDERLRSTSICVHISTFLSTCECDMLHTECRKVRIGRSICFTLRLLWVLQLSWNPTARAPNVWHHLSPPRTSSTSLSLQALTSCSFSPWSYGASWGWCNPRPFLVTQDFKSYIYIYRVRSQNLSSVRWRYKQVCVRLSVRRAALPLTWTCFYMCALECYRPVNAFLHRLFFWFPLNTEHLQTH